MAEPIGLAAGLLALAAFACKSCIALYDTVKSFEKHPKNVRDLLDGLNALSDVLSSLTETASTMTEVDLSALELPVLRCGNACKEFEQELLKCLSRSKGTRTSFRGWAQLKYMSGDINGFTQMLDGYKSTISIALNVANLHKSSVTAENLKTYSSMIKNATEDLESHLQNIDEKLESILARPETGPDTDRTELQLMKEERQSTQNCLQMCSQLSNHIDQLQRIYRNRRSHDTTNPDTFPERITNEGFEQCRESLRVTEARLESHMRDIINRIITKSRATPTSTDEFIDLARLQAEWETTRRSIQLISTADKDVSENISKIDNHATGDDTVQFLVSTNEKVIHGKNRGIGSRNRQVGGHVDSLSLRQMSRDMSRISMPNTEVTNLSWHTRSPSIPEDHIEEDVGSRQQKNYEQDLRHPTPDLHMYSKQSAEDEEAHISTPR